MKGGSVLTSCSIAGKYTTSKVSVSGIVVSNNKNTSSTITCAGVSNEFTIFDLKVCRSSKTNCSTFSGLSLIPGKSTVFK